MDDGIFIEPGQIVPENDTWFDVELIRINTFYPRHVFVSMKVAQDEVIRLNKGVYVAAENERPRCAVVGMPLKEAYRFIHTRKICAILSNFHIRKSSVGEFDVIAASCLAVDPMGPSVHQDLRWHPNSSFTARAEARVVPSAHGGITGLSIQRFITWDYVGEKHPLRDTTLVWDTRPVTPELFTDPK